MDTLTHIKSADFREKIKHTISNAKLLDKVENIDAIRNLPKPFLANLYGSYIYNITQDCRDTTTSYDSKRLQSDIVIMYICKQRTSRGKKFNQLYDQIISELDKLRNNDKLFLSKEFRPIAQNSSHSP